MDASLYQQIIDHIKQTDIVLTELIKLCIFPVLKSLDKVTSVLGPFPEIRLNAGVIKSRKGSRHCQNTYQTQGGDHRNSTGQPTAAKSTGLSFMGFQIQAPHL